MGDGVGGGNCDFLFSSLENEAHTKWGLDLLVFKKEFASVGGMFCFISWPY